MSGDPWIDLDTIPPELIAPIQEAIDRYRNSPRFEKDFGLFVIRLPPPGARIRQSKFQAIFHRHARTAAESERVIRQQTAELHAQEERTLAQSRADFLTSLSDDDRGLLAERLSAKAEAEARVAREYDVLVKQKAALAIELERVIAERDRLRAQLDRTIAQVNGNRRHHEDIGATAKQLAARNEALEKQVRPITQERDALRLRCASLSEQVQRLTFQNYECEAETGRWRQLAAKGARDAAQALGKKWK